MKNDKCGVYQILCLVSGKSYVGSSIRIYQRWYQHRRCLRIGDHRSPRLQRAWLKHGEENFYFSILEECDRNVLFEREQYWIDLRKRDYNSMRIVRVPSKEMVEKRIAALRALAALCTHCPKGHEYSEKNTRISRYGSRVCRACSAFRSNAANMAGEKRAKRIEQKRQWYSRNRESSLIKMRQRYALSKLT